MFSVRISKLQLEIVKMKKILNNWIQMSFSALRKINFY